MLVVNSPFCLLSNTMDGYFGEIGTGEVPEDTPQTVPVGA